LGFIVVLSISGTEQSSVGYDARYEERASVHVGKGSQHDFTDAKIWLEPEIEVARPDEP
jgi:hypothetical protein